MVFICSAAGRERCSSLHLLYEYSTVITLRRPTLPHRTAFDEHHVCLRLFDSSSCGLFIPCPLRSCFRFFSCDVQHVRTHRLRSRCGFGPLRLWVNSFPKETRRRPSWTGEPPGLFTHPDVSKSLRSRVPRARRKPLETRHTLQLTTRRYISAPPMVCNVFGVRCRALVCGSQSPRPFL